VRSARERIIRFIEEASSARTVTVYLAGAFFIAFGELSIDSHHLNRPAVYHLKLFVMRFVAIVGFFLLLQLIRSIRSRNGQST